MKRAIAATLPVLLAALAISASPASATVTGDNPCASDATYDWYGESIGVSQDIPSLASPGDTYRSTVLRPADTARYPGKRPVVILQHGRNGNRCSLWWNAQYLAGHGYVTEIHAAPADPNQFTAFAYAIDATRSAISFMKSPDNPAAAYSDTSRMGLTGHSLGSAVTSHLQGEPELGLDAIVATDNLRRFLQGDRGGSNQECAEPIGGEVTPLVPALGMAKDEPCNSTPQDTSPEIKQTGWSWWRENRQPTMGLVMRGFVHGDFSGDGQEEKKKDVGYYALAWFDRWLGVDQSDDRLLAGTVNGKPTASILSTQYFSGACLPGAVDTDRFENWITATPVRPSPMGACDDLATPSGLSVSPGSPATTLTPRIRGLADDGARIELFRTGTCSGEPVATGSGSTLAGDGIPVRVTRGSTTVFHARAINPVNGEVSACSSSSARYAQANPRLVRLSAAAKRAVRPGQRLKLRFSVRNTGQVSTAGRITIRVNSSNRRVSVRRKLSFPRASARRTVRATTVIRVSKRARGKARITVRSAGMKRTLVIRVQR